MKSLKEALNETRPWEQETDAKRDEGLEDQKPGFAPSPKNEVTKAPCLECGMVEGHTDECSHVSESDGDAFTESALDKRLQWGESSDYDGLPLTEGSMFDRFDTLVGHRFDGTFDDRTNDATRLRVLVKKVVREAWSSFDPKCGEEHTGEDREHFEEMKLSVAGPAFGSASDTDDQDDGDEDYKTLTPRKVPEPEKSGVRVKDKKKSKS